MSEDNMSAEQAPHSQGEAAQQEPLIDKDSWLASAGEIAGEKASVGQQSPSFTLAVEGPSLDNNISFSIAHPGRGRKGAGGGNPTIGPIPASGGQPHWGRRIALGAAGLLAAVGIGFGADRVMHNGDDDPERGAVADLTPLAEPINTPTPEATPTIEPQKAEKSPYEFGWEAKIGDTTVRIEDKLQTRTECPDPNYAKDAPLIPCFGVSELVIDRDNFPNVDSDMRETAQHAFYIAWRNQDASRKSITYDQYKEKLNSGEDLSFKSRGFQGSSFLPTDIIISPKDKVFLDFIAQPSPIIKPFTSVQIGYRKINDEIHLEVFSFTMGNPNEPDKKIAATANYLQALAFLSNYDVLKRGQITSNAEFQQFSDVMYEIVGNLEKKQADGTYISPLYTK